MSDTVWCKIGENQPTQIRVRHNANIDDLKKEIKKENPDLPAPRLITIYQSDQHFERREALRSMQKIPSQEKNDNDEPIPFYVHYPPPEPAQVLSQALLAQLRTSLVTPGGAAQVQSSSVGSLQSSKVLSSSQGSGRVPHVTFTDVVTTIEEIGVGTAVRFSRNGQTHTGILTAAHCLYIERKGQWQLMKLERMDSSVVKIGHPEHYFATREPQHDIAVWELPKLRDTLQYGDEQWCSKADILAMDGTMIDLVVHEMCRQHPKWEKVEMPIRCKVTHRGEYVEVEKVQKMVNTAMAKIMPCLGCMPDAGGGKEQDLPFSRGQSGTLAGVRWRDGRVQWLGVIVGPVIGEDVQPGQPRARRTCVVTGDAIGKVMDSEPQHHHPGWYHKPESEAHTAEQLVNTYKADFQLTVVWEASDDTDSDAQ